MAKTILHAAGGISAPSVDISPTAAAPLVAVVAGGGALALIGSVLSKRGSSAAAGSGAAAKPAAPAKAAPAVVAKKAPVAKVVPKKAVAAAPTGTKRTPAPAPSPKRSSATPAGSGTQILRDAIKVWEL